MGPGRFASGSTACCQTRKAIWTTAWSIQALLRRGAGAAKSLCIFFLEFRANPTFGCPEKVSKIWYGYIIYDTLRRRTYMFICLWTQPLRKKHLCRVSIIGCGILAVTWHNEKHRWPCWSLGTWKCLIESPYPKRTSSSETSKNHSFRCAWASRKKKSCLIKLIMVCGSPVYPRALWDDT